MSTDLPRLIGFQVWRHLRIGCLDGFEVCEVLDDNTAILYNGLDDSLLIVAVDALNSEFDGHCLLFANIVILKNGFKFDLLLVGLAIL